MNIIDVEYYYNYYKKSISIIKRIENKLLKCAYSYDKWTELLREKSTAIRDLYEGNEKHLKELLNITVDSLNKDLADKIITHVDFFVSEGYRDYQMVVAVLNVLTEYYEVNGPGYRLFDCYFYMGLQLMESHEYQRAGEFFEKALVVYEEPEECKEEWRRFWIMCCHYYRLLAAVCDDSTTQYDIYNYQKRALRVWLGNCNLVNHMDDMRKRAITNILHSLPCVAIDRWIRNGEDVIPELINNIKLEYDLQYNEYDGDELKVNNNIYVTYHKYQFVTGDITWEEYSELIRLKYYYERENEKIFSYGKSDFMDLFNDEILDDDFDVNKLFYMNHSYTYVNWLIPEMVDVNGKNEYLDEIERYFNFLPVMSGDYFIDYMIDIFIKRIFKYTEDVNEVVRIVEKIFLNRQVVTVIHCEMVSKLATLMTRRFLVKAPELFVGMCGTTNIAEVRSQGEAILGFVASAAKLHDVGKIMCSDIINLQSRRISDAEFAIIKEHAENGAEILEAIPATEPYRDIALGHHKAYNGKFGYPMGFDNTVSSERIIIDIIKICDCIDAATDILGRNYAKAKSFETVLKELIEGAGESYSDEIVNLITKDNELIHQISWFTREERRHTYYEIYKDMVADKVDFVYDDELHVREYIDEDMEDIVRMRGEAENAILEDYLRCKENSYVLSDGYGILYGYIFMEAKGEILEIVDLYIDKKDRRKGNGSYMLAEVEKIVKNKGYRKLKIRNITEGHADKFFWYSEFTNYDDNEYLQKYL